MEELIRGLQGKTLTKNKIFELLADIDVTTLGIAPKELKKPIEIKCDACLKIFTCNSSLKRHHLKNNACSTWLDLPEKCNNIPKKGLHLILDDLLKKSTSVDGKLECKYCHSTFTNTGNHHKHFNVSIVCNRLAHHAFKEYCNSL